MYTLVLKELVIPINQAFPESLTHVLWPIGQSLTLDQIRKIK